MYFALTGISLSSPILYIELVAPITLDPLHRMQSALDWIDEHPDDTYAMVATRFDIAPTTLRDRHRGTHLPRGQKGPRNLTLAQEDALITSINNYANRGTLLEPRHIKTLAVRLCGHNVGINWTSTFMRRIKDRVLSRFYKNQELARLKANTPETRHAFLTMVSLQSRV